MSKSNTDDDAAIFDQIIFNGKRLGDCTVGELGELSEQAAKSAAENLRKALALFLKMPR
jgi:hypothetical protein